MTMGDPKRLLDRASLGAFERKLLESALPADPPRTAEGALWGGLMSRVAAGGPGVASGAGAVGKSVAAGALLKHALIAAVVTGVAAASVTYEAPRTPKVAPVVASAVIAAPSAAPARTASPGPPAAASLAPDIIAPPPPAPARPNVEPTPPRPASSTAPPSAVYVREPPESPARAEGALVLEARAALRRGDCAGALARLDAATASFGAGMLRQEREALAVEALGCGGRASEASARASVFLRAYPASPYAEAVRRYVR
jgi:hypothetical protein